MADRDRSIPYIVTGGEMRVHALGQEGGSAPMVDAPEVAQQALDVFDESVALSGGQVSGAVHLRKPRGGLRLIRGGLDRSPDGGATGTGTGG